MNNEKIAAFIKEKRKQKKLTQEGLANKLNVTEKAISRWETGRGTPDISLLIPLAKELEVSVSEILKGEENDNSINSVIEYINKNKRKNKIPLFTAIFLYVLAIIEFLCFLKFEYHPDYLLWGEDYLFFLLLIGVTIILANFIVSNYYIDKLKNQEIIKKISYGFLFLCYFCVLLNLTIFNRDTLHYKVGYNIIPFSTIIESFKLNNNIKLIFINLILYMPLEYFLIELFEIKKISVNLFISFFTVFLIEIFQYLLNVGVFDIDDILISFLGVIIFYISYKFIIKLKKKYKN